MSNRFQISMLMAIALFIVVPTVAVAQGTGPNSPAERAKWVRDFNGVWSPAAAQQDITANLLPGEEISLTPFGAEQYNKIDEADSPAYRCEPHGPTRMLMSAEDIMIVQQENVLIIVSEHINDGYRIVYINGKHPTSMAYPEWN